ncbi:MAG: NAD-dependent epimerase/dehydratase family protein [Blastocatellia bacterium]
MSERNGKGRSNGHAPANLLKLTRPNGSHAVANGRNKPVLITGGAGFVGTNLAHRLLEDGRRVLLLDNLSRAGVEENLRWLKQTYGERVQLAAVDVRNFPAVLDAVSRASQVFHFAAQVAVTTSLVDPIHDFDINARGTLNILEAIRSQKQPPPLVFTSTNKVYGGLEDIVMRKAATRYEPADTEVRRHGIGEARPLDFHSPYGCSKGAADQYVRDYARSYGLPAIVFRMSCIYGPHQFGNEDQGWVAHFLIRAIQGQPITLYGDGLQVRDVLFVEDLVDALLLAQTNMDALAGQVFNIGGGAANTTSLLELLNVIERLHGRSVVEFEDWRVGDQRYYVSDTRRFQQAAGWSPRVTVTEGIERLYAWLNESRRSLPARLIARRTATMSQQY